MSRVQRTGELLNWRNSRALSKKFPGICGNKYKVSCLALSFFERTDELLADVADSRRCYHLKSKIFSSLGLTAVGHYRY